MEQKGTFTRPAERSNGAVMKKTCSTCLVLIAGLVGFWSGCGGTQPAAESAPPPEAPATAAPPPAASAPTAGAEAPQKLWKDRSKDERREYMKTVVAPKMAGLFKEFDAKRFADPNCMTCHGSGAKAGTFQMPNPELPKLTSFEAEMKEHPEITKFMAEKVVPEMAKMLDMPPFDPATKQGFGCAGCHTFKK